MSRRIATALVLLGLAGCAVSTDYDPYVAAIENQLEARSYQTRTIEDTDYDRLVTAVISTLQDYHFRIVHLDPELGTITAYQVTGYQRGTRQVERTELTVLIRERGELRFSVRMNMSVGLEIQERAELYQQFFAALDRKLHYQTRT
jgi:hypothetical protein